MPYTQNEINAKLIFLIEPEFKKAERFEQKPNPCSRNNRRVIW